jgi:hypothetical protein
MPENKGCRKCGKQHPNRMRSGDDVTVAASVHRDVVDADAALPERVDPGLIRQSIVIEAEPAPVMVGIGVVAEVEAEAGDAAVAADADNRVVEDAILQRRPIPLDAFDSA